MLTLTLFGKLEIDQGDGQASNLKSAKAKALLVYLAMTSRPHSRSRLAGLLWGEKSDDNARMNLSQALTALRKHHGEYLDIRRETVSIRHNKEIYVDVTQFEKNLSHSGKDITSLEEAVQLYQGDFLEDLIIKNAPDFNSWVYDERQQLRKKCLTTLYILVDHFTDKGEPGWPEAINYVSRILAIEPTEEKAHRHMMRLLAYRGRPDAAIQQFKECRATLKEHLDLEPSPSTIRLVDQIRQGELAPTTKMVVTQNRALPPLVTPLIGRKDDIENLHKKLTHPEIRLVTITGMGGIGKTHLTLSIAHDMKDGGEFQDGVIFVPLSSVSTRSDLLAAIAEQAGISLTGHRFPEKAVLDSFGDKYCLIILDNFEQLMPEVDIVSKLLQAATQIKLLVTSRERLKLRNEWILELEGLSYPVSLKKSQALEYDALRLFSERAKQIMPNLIVEDEIENVHRICHLTNGLPLAIEQAASRLHGFQVSEIADQIEDHMVSLSSVMQDVPERHRSMRAVLEWSWQLLSREEQEVFTKLAVFEGSFSPHAANQVTGVDRSTLNSLNEKSLLQFTTTPGGNRRFEFHQFVREFAREQLSGSGKVQVKQVHKAHLDYYLTLAEEGRQYYDTVQDKKWLAKLEPERGNFQAAIRWAIDHQLTEPALRLNAALVSFWVYKSPAGEPKKWLDPALSLEWENSPDSTIEARAEALIIAGYAAIQTMELDHADMRFKEGGNLYTRLGNQMRYAWVLRGHGLICLIRGDLEEGRKFLKESLSLCEEKQNLWGVAWTLHELGNIELADNNLDNAEHSLSRAMEIFRQQGRELGIFHALISMGALRRKQMRWPEALSLYQKALVIQDKTQYIQYLSQILEGLAHIALNVDHPETAVKLLAASQARRDSIEAARWAHHEIEFQQNLGSTREVLSTSDWKTAWDKGYELPPHATLAFAKHWYKEQIDQNW